MKREVPVRRIAVVGAGISGLSAAWLLSQRYEVTLYEAADYLGGHTNTVDVTIDDPELCGRYTARVVRNVKIGPSPEWLARRVIAPRRDPGLAGRL